MSLITHSRINVHTCDINETESLHSLLYYFLRILVAIDFKTKLVSFFYPICHLVLLSRLISGICCNPPDPPENAECVYGRSLNNIYARYTAKDVESFDHCPVSVCKENNAWSAFNITLSCKF